MTEDRLAAIKRIWGSSAANSDICWLIEEVDRLREARIADLDYVVNHCKHVGLGDNIVALTAHKKADGLRYLYKNERCSKDNGRCGKFLVLAKSERERVQGG